MTVTRGTVVEVHGGAIGGKARLQLALGGSRAGSTLTMSKALQNLMDFTGLPLHRAMMPLTSAPAELLKLGNRKGRIETGLDADIAVLDPDLSVRLTIAGQRIIYQQE